MALLEDPAARERALALHDAASHGVERDAVRFDRFEIKLQDRAIEPP